MTKLNKKEFSAAYTLLWNKRQFLSLEELSEEANLLYSRFEMRVQDLIDHLEDIKNQKGNIKVLKEELNSGTLHLVNIHLQQRNDTNNEWVVSIY